MMIKKKTILYTGVTVTIACDGRCDKAWGKVQRRRQRDGITFAPDAQLGLASKDPGTYEGPDAKPESLAEFPNRWCVRACERSAMTEGTDRVVIRTFDEGDW